jgi:hypothetical protein
LTKCVLKRVHPSLQNPEVREVDGHVNNIMEPTNLTTSPRRR